MTVMKKLFKKILIGVGSPIWITRDSILPIPRMLFPVNLNDSMLSLQLFKSKIIWNAIAVNKLLFTDDVMQKSIRTVKQRICLCCRNPLSDVR